MNYHFDTIVIGGGTMGTAAAYYLSKKGQRVLVLEQFSIPNDKASHHGDTRMFRLANGDGEKYVPLGKAALRLWEELEADTGKTLFQKSGALSIGYSGSDFIKKAIESSVTHQLEYEKLTADEIKDRWPGITIPDDYYGCLDPNAGFLFSEECIRTYKEEAEKLGAVLKEYEPATEIIRMRNEVKVITGKAQYSANHLIITAGAWTHKLVKNINLPITIIRKTIGWFEPMKKGMYDHHFPCFVFKTESDGNYYGFPNFNGSGVKLGRMDEGHLSDPDKLNREFGSFENDEGDLRRFLEKYMPNASGTMLNGKVCMFSMTPNEDFIVDRDPEFDNIIIAGGFSGRGFKFASVIGSILSDLVVEGETTHDISSFQIKRFMEQQA